jgi:hypothetical protein
VLDYVASVSAMLPKGDRNLMKTQRLLKNTFVAAVLCGVLTFAQEPVQNIDKERHPNLAEAQRLVAEANRRIIDAQNVNHEDMRGHAEKARQLLVQASQELKLAAQAANANAAGKKAK